MRLFFLLVDNISCCVGRNEDEEGRKELQPGDNLDPNEIYFLSDCTGGLQKLVHTSQA